MQESQPEILGSAKLVVSRLKATFQAKEAEIIAKRLIEWVSGKPWFHFISHPEAKYSPEQQKILDNAVERLLLNEPLQYIMGACWFMGHSFKVSPAVLIPRPETEELVDWIFQSAREIPSPKLLDIGTGSGCIAISLSLCVPQSEVSALDISDDALAIASHNNVSLGGRVQFRELDVFAASPQAFKDLDIIVSNPPYVLETERAMMMPNVVDFEPSIALFVPDDDPLLYYRRILHLAKHWLKPGGWVFFEINEGKAEGVLALGADLGFEGGVVKKDMQGKERMVRFHGENAFFKG